MIMHVDMMIMILNVTPIGSEMFCECEYDDDDADDAGCDDIDEC